MTKTLAEQLEQRLREADFWRPLDRSRVECFAGGRRCPTWPRFAGVCKVPYHRGRKLYIRCGLVSALSCDPIENKPSYRSLLGTRALSLGTLGCDLNCGYCQNRIREGQAARNVPLRHVHADDARSRTRDLENTFGPGCRPSASERRAFASSVIESPPKVSARIAARLLVSRACRAAIVTNQRIGSTSAVGDFHVGGASFAVHRDVVSG